MPSLCSMEIRRSTLLLQSSRRWNQINLINPIISTPNNENYKLINTDKLDRWCGVDHKRTKYTGPQRTSPGGINSSPEEMNPEDMACAIFPAPQKPRSSMMTNYRQPFFHDYAMYLADFITHNIMGREERSSPSCYNK